MVEIENLVKRYGDFVALDHLNLHISEGEVFGLLGPNGCGKTTAMNCLLALLKYDKGEIRVMGEPIRPDSYELKGQIGVVPQNVAVFEELNVLENIDYFCGLYVKDKVQRKKMVEEAIAFVGLEKYKKMRPKQLSGGLLRRLNIACGIAHKPKLIIMDEPTRGIDVGAKAEIEQLIQELSYNGISILMISSEIAEIERNCDRVIVMREGKKIDELIGDEISHERIMETIARGSEREVQANV